MADTDSTTVDADFEADWTGPYCRFDLTDSTSHHDAAILELEEARALLVALATGRDNPDDALLAIAYKIEAGKHYACASRELLLRSIQ